MHAPLVSVVVPVRPGEPTDQTMTSLAAQTFQDFEVHVVVDVDRRGAPWARNRGAERAAGEYLLFSDADITWDADALEVLVATLREVQQAEQEARARRLIRLRTTYAYGGYRLLRDGAATVHANEPWDLETLLTRNIVSTMALVDRASFSGFDETLHRLQDWDLWLGMALYRRMRGQWVGRCLFSTTYNPAGITGEGEASYRRAWDTVRRKYRLAR